MAIVNFLDAVIEDAANKAIKYSLTSYYGFLEPNQQKIAEHEIIKYPGAKIDFFGGHEYCERRIMRIAPDYESNDEASYPCEVISIKLKNNMDLTHRDVLGSLIGLGIEREKIGDIQFTNNLCQIFLYSPMGSFVLDNLTSISRFTVEPKLIGLNEVTVVEPEFTSEVIIIPSMRLDAIVHSAYHMSRNDASNFVKNEMVSINHEVAKKQFANLKNGDIVSVRTKGRFIVDDISGVTKKGNIRLQIRKFN